MMTGRKALFTITFSMSILIGILMYIFGADTIWHAWAVPTLSPFADLRDVLQGIDSARVASGASNNPFGLVGGYPAIWSLLGLLGIGANSLQWVALVVLGIYWTSLFIFVQDIDIRTAMCISIIVFSPAAMLGYERGNLDLLIFSLSALALALSSLSNIPTVGLITLTAMLKIYPIVGLVYLLKEPRNRFLIWAGAGLGLFFLYAISIGRALTGIVGYIARGGLFDYGTEVVGFRLFEIGGPRSLTDIVTIASYLVLYILILTVLYWSHAIPDRAARDEARYLDAFRIGAAIYIATFIEGNSFNYRLIFLLFCIPQIILWTRIQTPVRTGARITITALIASCWAIFLSQFIPVNLAFTLDQLAKWILFASLLYLFIVTLPEWLLKEIDGFFDRHHLGGRKVSLGMNENIT